MPGISFIIQKFIVFSYFERCFHGYYTLVHERNHGLGGLRCSSFMYCKFNTSTDIGVHSLSTNIGKKALFLCEY